MPSLGEPSPDGPSACGVLAPAPGFAGNGAAPPPGLPHPAMLVGATLFGQRLAGVRVRVEVEVEVGASQMALPFI